MLTTPVQDVISTLSFGVLNNTDFSNYRTLGDVESQMNLIVLIQEALTRLYTRFVLRNRTMIIEHQVGVTHYHLDKRYAVQSHDPIAVPYPYIMDLPNDKFDNDVVKISQVQNSLGQLMPLNNPNLYDSLFTPQYDMIHNPAPVPLDIMYVTYQSKHATLAMPISEGWEIVNEVFLPDVLYPALYNYVAYLVYSRMATQEANAKAAANLMLYEEVCRDVERMDLVNNSMSCTNTRFRKNGWE